MTKWVLKCTICGGERILDVGFDLREFKQLYVYCKFCGATRPHRVLAVSEESTNPSGSGQ